MSIMELIKTVAQMDGTKRSVNFWIFVTGVLVAVNTFFALTLLQMAPKLQVTAQILTTPMTSGALIETEPFSTDVGDKALIDEMLIRYYLTMRHTFFPDDVEILRRWSTYGPIFVLSTPTVFRQFRDAVAPMTENIRKAGYTQNIDIRSVSRNGNIFTVDFDLYTMMGGAISKQSRVSIVEIEYDPGNVFYMSEYANPYGLTVKGYKESEKK